MQDNQYHDFLSDLKKKIKQSPYVWTIESSEK